MIIDLSVRVKKKIREKRAGEECYCRHTELQISHKTSKLSEASNWANLTFLVSPAYPTVFKIKDIMASNSLFKCIKIQRMQVF